MNRRNFERFAWFFVAWLVATILFGAWVRISGSGDGCGSHWPACNGSVIPQSPSTKTIIEFSHRMMTGCCGIFAIVLLVWARRLDRPVFRAAGLAFAFLIVESLLGALLVKAHLVVNDASMSRAIVVALHLANTLMLTSSAALVAWRAGSRSAPFMPAASRGLLGAVLLALLLTNMTGAVTALGDTVFPTKPALDGSLFAKLGADASPGQHFLVRLRVIHPGVAVLAAFLAAGVLLSVARRGSAGAKLAGAACAAVLVQVALGTANVALAAPGWMQIVHLLMAQIVWLLTWLVFLARGEGHAEAWLARAA
jgi:heme A synthase